MSGAKRRMWCSRASCRRGAGDRSHQVSQVTSSYVAVACITIDATDTKGGRNHAGAGAAAHWAPGAGGPALGRQPPAGCRAAAVVAAGSAN